MEYIKSEAREEIKEKMKQLRDSGKLPRGYAKKVQERLAARGIEVSISNVRHVAAGQYASPEVVDELLAIAEENRELTQLKRLNKLLEKD